MIELLEHAPEPEELALLRPDPLLVEQELDVRPAFARALERVLGARAGRCYWRSNHDHLYALELGDLGRGWPSLATVYGHWERYEPRPPEHEIDRDLADLCVWLAQRTGELDPADVGKVLQFAGVSGGWPPGSVLRTPEERLADLPGYPWQPRYLEVEGLRIAYLDETGREAGEECFLLLHGEPTWSYLYRHMVPVLAEAGRVVAPDLPGFGRSDKPVSPAAYSYRSHARWLRKLIEALELRRVTLVCQDWGGLLGLRVLSQLPERFRRVVAMNTLLPDGRLPPSEAFLRWRRFSQSAPSLDVAALMKRAVRRPGFTEGEALAYAAPFPAVEYQTGALAFPRLVPTRADQLAAFENRQARARLAELELPVLLVFSDGDPVTAPAEADLRRLFRNVAPAVTIAGAGHFLQEDRGVEIAERILEWMEATP